MRLKLLASNLALVVVAVVAIGIVTGIHVKTQSPFLVFGSSSGSSQVIKSTSNALWVSIQAGTSLANGSASAGQGSLNWRGTDGIYSRAAGRLDFASSGFTYTDMGTNGMTVWNGGAYGWTAGDATLAVDTQLSRALPGEITTSSVLFAALGTPANGTFTFCTDCTVTTPATCPATKASCVCAGSGTGALAVRLNGSWDCTLFQ